MYMLPVDIKECDKIGKGELHNVVHTVICRILWGTFSFCKNWSNEMQISESLSCWKVYGMHGQVKFPDNVWWESSILIHSNICYMFYGVHGKFTYDLT